MSVTAKALINAHFALAAASTEYTCPVNTHAIIDHFVVCNTDIGGQTISINIVPSGSSLSSANQMLQLYSLAAGATVTIDIMTTAVLNAGDYISCLASVANKVVIRASGREVT